MSVATSLIPGLDEIVRDGDPKRLADAVRRIAELLVQGAVTFRPDHVDLFDRVLIDLVPHTGTPARTDLAGQLSALANGPKILLGHLAREDELSVAGPVLRRSPVLDEDVLIEIARMKGQGHLLAIAERPTLSADLTDVILRRGDRDVVRRTAANSGALFSRSGHSALIRRAATDGVLTLKLGQREDLPDQLLKELLAGSIEVVRRRLFEMATPERQAAIGRAIREMAADSVGIESRKDFVPAQRTVLKLHHAGNLNEAALLGFSKEYRYEETVAALSAMSWVASSSASRPSCSDFDTASNNSSCLARSCFLYSSTFFLSIADLTIAVRNSQTAHSRLRTGSCQEVEGIFCGP